MKVHSQKNAVKLGGRRTRHTADQALAGRSRRQGGLMDGAFLNAERVEAPQLHLLILRGSNSRIRSRE